MKNKLLFIALWLGAVSGAHAQGMIPALTSTNTVTTIAIGDRVPPGLTVLSSSGAPRSLLSYKSPLELIALIFDAPGCEATALSLPVLKRLVERMTEWDVAFVLVGDADRPGLPIPRVQDPDGRLRSYFGVSAAPTLVLIDEWTTWRFRGPVRATEAALKTVIGHLEPLNDPLVPVENGCPFP